MPSLPYAARLATDLSLYFTHLKRRRADFSNTLSCRMSNIRPGGNFDINYNIKFLPDSFADKYKSFLLKDGDIIIAMTDLANDPKILGLPTIVKTCGKQILLNQRVGKLFLLKKDELNIRKRQIHPIFTKNMKYDTLSSY